LSSDDFTIATVSGLPAGDAARSSIEDLYMTFGEKRRSNKAKSRQETPRMAGEASNG
jgi:hypothetical protein